MRKDQDVVMECWTAGRVMLIGDSAAESDKHSKMTIFHTYGI
jgi:hypothetical protein